MDFLLYQSSFDRLLGVKSEPNEHENMLFSRAQKYIQKITWIPGIRLIAVVNSLSMYATHTGSDIDLFFITAKNRMWIVRVFVTLTFWIYGVWRRGDDVAGNFCLSFFIEETAIDLSKIAIEDDIYLYYWIYYMKPIFVVEERYDTFLEANRWVTLPQEQREKNLRYCCRQIKKSPSKSVFSRYLENILTIFNTGLQFFGEKISRASYRRKGCPPGILITSDMLKFHDEDRRPSLRDEILGSTR